MSAERLLEECRLQLKYLNEKFGETGTTNALLSKLEANQSKEKQKQALIDMMKGDEELGLYKKPQQQSVEELIADVTSNMKDRLMIDTAKMCLRAGYKFALNQKQRR
jgi:hypothetical protein